MGKCKYCGLSAGLLSSVHPECEAKHNKGKTDLQVSLKGFFAGSEQITSVQAGNYISKEEVEESCRQALRTFADTIHLPITKQYLQTIDIFLNNIGISRSVLNRNEDLDAVALRFYQGVLTSYFAENEPIAKVEKRARMVTGLLPVSSSMKETAGLTVLDKAAKNFLDDGLITDVEQAKLDDFSQSLQLPMDNLPQTFNGQNIEKMQQAAILRQIQRGQVPPPKYASVPVMLTSGEFVVWEYMRVTMYQEKVTKEWVGRRRGWSFRVMKGVYYHVGGSKGHPVEHSKMERQGTGSLILTNKNIIFFSTQKATKVSYKKLIGVTPYSDGVEIQKDEATPKRRVFQGFDCWFMVNLLTSINII